MQALDADLGCGPVPAQDDTPQFGFGARRVHRVSWPRYTPKFMTRDEALSLLGIDADADAWARKRAHLRRIKQTKPERDPEGFKSSKNSSTSPGLLG